MSRAQFEQTATCDSEAQKRSDDKSGCGPATRCLRGRRGDLFRGGYFVQAATQLTPLVTANTFSVLVDAGKGMNEQESERSSAGDTNYHRATRGTADDKSCAQPFSNISSARSTANDHPSADVLLDHLGAR